MRCVAELPLPRLAKRSRWSVENGFKRKVTDGVVRRRSRLTPNLLELEHRQLLSTFTVTNTLDTVTNGIPAMGSLRWAVEAAEADGGTDELINFSSTVFNTPQTIAPQTPIEIASAGQEITIAGPSAGLLTMDNSDAGTAFQVDADGTATISGMTIINSGGGGAVRDFGMLTVSGCTLTSGGGSGVYAAGVADISDCIITDNNCYQGGGVNVTATGTVTITNTTLSDNTTGGGGGLWNDGNATMVDCVMTGNSTLGAGGGMYNTGELTATGCTISGDSGTGVNNAAGGITYLNGCTISGVTSGNGILNSGQLTVKSCTISGTSQIGIRNDAGTAYVGDSTISGGSGIIFGGNLLNQVGGTLTLTDCTISGGTGGSGAGLYNGGTATVTDCTFSDNSSPGTGGGISNGPLQSSAVLILADSTLVGNTTPQEGGGLYNNGTATLIDDTIANNVGTGSAIGAGVANADITTLIACTISGNTTGLYGGGILDSGGVNSGSEMRIYDTIVAGNITENGTVAPNDIGVGAGITVSGACNLIGPGGSGGLVDGDDGNIILSSTAGLDLAPLANNGGLTQTMALQKGSPAIEAGEPFSGLTSDQRGDPLDSPYPDIGAYQTSTDRGTLVNYVVTNTLDDGSPGSLRWAVDELDATNRSSTIEFQLGTAPASITLTQGPLVLSNTFLSISIAAPAAGLTVSGNGESGVFQIDSDVTASISGFDIIDGSATEGAGVFNEGAASLTDCTISGSSASTDGGGIANTGTLTLTDCTISDNSATNGGGLYNAGTASLDACTLNVDAATTGGGIDNLTAATATLEDTIVAGNMDGRLPNDIGGSNAGGVVGSYDLIGIGGRGGIVNGDDNDIVLTNLRTLGLASLGDYGGSTQTEGLLPGSPAIGAGTSLNGLATDQRGQPLDSPLPDMGAFQSQAFEATALTGSTPQSAGTGAEFEQPLAVLFNSDNPDQPVIGGLVNFAVLASSNGACAILSSGSAVIASNGVAEITATANATLGSYTVTASASGVTTVDFDLTNLDPLTFTNVTDQTVPYGTPTLSVSGILADGSEIPVGGSVTITLDGNVQQATIGTDGGFSAVFSTSSLTAADSPYPISLSYAGNSSFASATMASSLIVATATPTVTVNDAGGTYNETGFPATASVAGISGSASSSLEGVGVTVDYYTGTYNNVSQLVNLTPLSQTPSIADSYTAVATFAGSADYSSAAALADFTIAPATPTVAVVDAGGTYNDAPFPATDSIKGIGGSAGSSLEGVPVLLSYYSGTFTTASQLTGLKPLSGAPTVASPYTAVASFAGSINYAKTTQLANFTIAQVTPTVTVADTGGTYNGEAFAAANSVKGLSGTAGSTLENVALVVDYYSGIYSTAFELTGLTPLSATPSEAGSYTVAANFPGSTDYSTASQLANFTINQATPTVTVADAGGTYTGQPFAATTSVAGISGQSASSLENASPSLSYYSGTYASASQLTGLTPLSATPVAAGSYTVLATFPGTTDYTTANNLVDFAIAKAQPLVTWNSPASIVYGTPLGALQLDASANVAGNPSYSPAPGSFVAAGTDQTLSVMFTPSDSVDYSTVTATTTITVNKATPTLNLSDSGGHYTGNPFPASVTITGAGNDTSAASSLDGVTPTLTYYVGSGTSGTALGAAPPTATGTYTVVASFAGAANYLPVQSTPVSFTITVGDPTVELTSSTSSAVYGQPITFVATLTPGDPSAGTVTFLDDGTPLGTVPVNPSGSATLTTSLLAPGSHSITAAYSGDSLLVSATPGRLPPRSLRPAPRSFSYQRPSLRRKKSSPKTSPPRSNQPLRAAAFPPVPLPSRSAPRKRKKLRPKSSAQRPSTAEMPHSRSTPRASSKRASPSFIAAALNSSQRP